MALLKPFYQGKLDTFCAIYAVLNALRLTHGIRTLKARDILNSTLLSLSSRPAEFQAFLNQETDYLSLVDSMLDDAKNAMPLEIIRPFDNKNEVEKKDFWKECCEWLGTEQAPKPNRAIIFRFLRHMDPGKAPLNRHWTTADRVRDDVLHLFDCSHEAEAILNIHKNSFVISSAEVDKNHLLCIQPNTVRFLRLPF